MKDTLQWSQTFAQNYLINLMIEAAEKRGVAILAIQHQTKGGTYVGSTFLKHTTTAMLEMRFDSLGKRYAEFSKNRRGGSVQNKPVYFNLDKETKQVTFDEDKWRRFEDAESMSDQEQKLDEIAQETFTNVFDVTRMMEERKAEDEAVENALEREEEPTREELE